MIRLTYAENVSTEITFNVGESRLESEGIEQTLGSESKLDLRVQAKQIRDLIIVRVRNMDDSTIGINTFNISIEGSTLMAAKGPKEWKKENLVNAVLFTTKESIKPDDKGYFLLKVDSEKPLIKWEAFGTDGNTTLEGPVTPFMR